MINNNLQALVAGDLMDGGCYVHDRQSVEDQQIAVMRLSDRYTGGSLAAEYLAERDKHREINGPDSYDTLEGCIHYADDAEAALNRVTLGGVWRQRDGEFYLDVTGGWVVNVEDRINVAGTEDHVEDEPCTVKVLVGTDSSYENEASAVFAAIVHLTEHYADLLGDEAVSHIHQAVMENILHNDEMRKEYGA